MATNGIITMRMVSEGKTNEEITAQTGISSSSIGAYKAWNTMYTASINQEVSRRVALKGRNEIEQNADAEFLRSCGITFSVEARNE